MLFNPVEKCFLPKVCELPISIEDGGWLRAVAPDNKRVRLNFQSEIPNIIILKHRSTIY